LHHPLKQPRLPEEVRLRRLNLSHCIALTGSHRRLPQRPAKTVQTKGQIMSAFQYHRLDKADVAKVAKEFLAKNALS